MNRLLFSELIGKGYKEFWFFKGRYRVVKGSRGSKKSKTAALWFIFNMMLYKGANLLVVRKTYRTLKDSCFAELKWAVSRLGADEEWSAKASPLEMTYLPTGQKIFFRGLDDPLKVTSIAAENGSLCWMWIEEAYEISDEKDFNILDESIRGQVGEGLFKQITLTFNPWNERHWLKKRFFDVSDPEILALTTNYKMNEFLDEADIKMFEDMRVRNPKRYSVAGLGNWGISEGVVFENWEESSFDLSQILKIKGAETVFGLDFGYTNDPTALFCGVVFKAEKTIYVFDELYERGLTNFDIAQEIKKLGYGKEKIRADAAEPKSIEELRQLGLKGIRASRKGKDSILNGIQFIRNYKIIVSPLCCNFLTEISNYSWDSDKQGHKINRPVDDFNHLMDAMRYAVEDIISGDRMSFE
ncbi:MAG: PBSX family phage terminase large subunit [Clostridiales bacterium]|nr:PBSX family phage terminase large subunit [Clostridiales bacterium]